MVPFVTRVHIQIYHKTFVYRKVLENKVEQSVYSCTCVNSMPGRMEDSLARQPRLNVSGRRPHYTASKAKPIARQPIFQQQKTIKVNYYFVASSIYHIRTDSRNFGEAHTNF